MKISVIGGHGKVAMLLHPLLVSAGHEVRALIRNAAQADAVRETGAIPVLCDVERTDDISEEIGNPEVVVFAAGSGAAGSGRKFSMDRDGLIKTVSAAKNKGRPRIVAISTMDALAAPTEADRLRLRMEWAADGRIFRNSKKPEGVSPEEHERHKADYVEAKVQADEALKKSGLDFTLLKPGLLTDAPPSGLVRLSTAHLPFGHITRSDLANLISLFITRACAPGLELEAIDDGLHR